MTINLKTFIISVAVAVLLGMASGFGAGWRVFRFTPPPGPDAEVDLTAPANLMNSILFTPTVYHDVQVLTKTKTRTEFKTVPMTIYEVSQADPDCKKCMFNPDGTPKYTLSCPEPPKIKARRWKFHALEGFAGGGGVLTRSGDVLGGLKGRLTYIPAYYATEKVELGLAVETSTIAWGSGIETADAAVGVIFRWR